MSKQHAQEKEEEKEEEQKKERLRKKCNISFSSTFLYSK